MAAAPEDLVKFVGTWKHDKDDNFDNFLKEMGIGPIKRAAATKLKPTLIIEVNGDTVKVTRKGVGPMKDHVESCKLNVEQENTTPDGHKVKQTTTCLGGKLKSDIQPMSKDIKPSTVIREVNGDELVTTMTVNSVTATRRFKRQK